MRLRGDRTSLADNAGRVAGRDRLWKHPVGAAGVDLKLNTTAFNERALRGPTACCWLQNRLTYHCKNNQILCCTD